MRANLLPAGIQARERQQLLQQIQQMSRRRANALHGLLCPLRQRLRNAHLEQLGVADDGRKRSAQIVRDDGEEVGLPFIGPP